MPVMGKKLACSYMLTIDLLLTLLTAPPHQSSSLSVKNKGNWICHIIKI